MKEFGSVRNGFISPKVKTRGELLRKSNELCVKLGEFSE
jgi:hypothetical protein